MISLTDALTDMDEQTINGAAKAFDISFIRFHESKGEGGEIIELKNVVKCGQKYSMKNKEMIAVRQMDSSNHPYPIRKRLIISYNGQPVFY